MHKFIKIIFILLIVVGFQTTFANNQEENTSDMIKAEVISVEKTETISIGFNEIQQET